MMRTARFWMVVLLMAGTAALLQVRGDHDRVPPSEPLSGMPQTIGSWHSTDVPLDQEVLDVLGKGVFLNRLYRPAAASEGAGQTKAGSLVGLFIGYFPTQRSGQSIHSPQHCLPGAGWVFESAGVTDLTEQSGRRLQVGEYLISNGASKQEVLYWYRSHGRNIANDYTAKLYTMLDAIRYSRTDAALVRVVTPLGSGETQADAHLRAVDFAQRMSPLLTAFIPD